MNANALHVVCCYSNPLRWATRLKLHRQFETHMLDSGVQLTAVECAYGERPFELADTPHVNRVRARAKTMLWNKECLLNRGISALPDSAKYICWADADIEFRKASWASDTVNALQHYDVVQPWSDAYDLGPHDEHIQSHKSFLRQFWLDQPVHSVKWSFAGSPYDYPHSGYAWAATRQALEWLGGLLDIAIMGAGDHHMALALVGAVQMSVPGLPGQKNGVTAAYWRHLQQWQQRAMFHVNRNLGFVWGTVEHNFHGRKDDRKYVDRWEIVTRNAFDPDTDIKRNTYGVWEVAGNKPQLAHDLDRYFVERNEDINSL